MKSLTQLVSRFDEGLRRLPSADAYAVESEQTATHDRARLNLAEDLSRDLEETEKRRFLDEIEGHSSIEAFLIDDSVSEILLNGPDSIWVERAGVLERAPFDFLSASNYERWIERICFESGVVLNLEKPFADGTWRGLRLHLVRPPITRHFIHVSLRRHPRSSWKLETLQAGGWCTPDQAQILRGLISDRKNLLVVGPTGSGKTSVLNALLADLPDRERTALLEDADELALPTSVSYKLLCRSDANGLLPDVTLMDLLRQSLRMRPDRIVIGEIRGGEAKDLLLTLSSGHAGSMGTLHARTATQALLRLETLVQVGAPSWSVTTVRRLIQSGLDTVVVCGRRTNGQRICDGIFNLASLEDHGFTLDQMDRSF